MTALPPVSGQLVLHVTTDLFWLTAWSKAVMLLSCTLKVDGEHAGSVASFTLPSSRERFLVGCGSGCSLVTEQYETPGGGG